MKAKPILFRTDMVRALLEARKTVTRRVIKGVDAGWTFRGLDRDPAVFSVRADGEVCPKTVKGLYATFEADPSVWFPMFRAPWEVGDVPYVREAWCPYDKDHVIDGNKYAYKADETEFSEPIRKAFGYKWRPSIHMPKEAARIFLKVTGVRAERLKVIIEDPPGPNNQAVREGFIYGCAFIAAWNRLIKPADLDKYGWDANPWVWVIEFKRINWEEAIRYSEL